jgi:proteic killer suppression protein
MTISRIKHKGLRELFEQGVTARIDVKFQDNALLILDHLDAIIGLEDCRGVKDFHALKGRRTGQYSMHVSGNWCITFTFEDGRVEILDLEDYH